jgi:hypothetical protein
MLVTFTTKANADIAMFGDVAIAMLKMMGRIGTVPSAIRAEDVPEAPGCLKAAVEAGKTRRKGRLWRRVEINRRVLPNDIAAR